MSGLFWIGDRLPTAYDVAVTINFHSKKVKSDLRSKTIYRYVNALQDVWVRSFGEDHVCASSVIRNKVEHVLADYEKRVQKSKSAASQRVRNKEWIAMDFPQPKRGRKYPEKKISDLFDIGKDMEGLTGREKIFYEDQRTERRHLLSHEVDEEHESEKEAARAEEMEREEQHNNELSFIDEEFSENTSVSKKRGPPSKERVVVVEKAIQTDEIHCGEKDIRPGRNFTYEIKDAIATVSSKAGVSVAKARVCTQVVCKKMYGDCYQLEVSEESSNPPLSKKTRTADDYKRYKKVLPSPKVINTFKHKKALCQEIVAAKSLMNKKVTTKVTLHFDTTSRSRIEGDWPALILNFLDEDPADSKMISLRPIHFAFEDKEQIVSLFIETLHRLSIASNDHNFTVTKVWEQIDATMTDSPTKNLGINPEVAKKIGSDHIPLSLLCKAHTCERLDADNISSLLKIEAKIGLREMIAKREPLLNSFLRKQKCVVVAALEALLKLVALEGDGKTTSLREQFDLKLEERGVCKSLSLYKEKRFTKLGYQAGAVYDCLSYFNEILEETHLNNLLVRSCKI